MKPRGRKKQLAKEREVRDRLPDEYLRVISKLDVKGRLIADLKPGWSAGVGTAGFTDGLHFLSAGTIPALQRRLRNVKRCYCVLCQADPGVALRHAVAKANGITDENKLDELLREARP